MNRIALLVCSLLVLPAVANADPFSATFGGAVSGTTVQGTFVSNGVRKSFNVFAGQLLWETDVDKFLSFCLQLDSPLLKEQQFVESTPTHISSSAATQIAKLISMTGGSGGSSLQNAAIQLAIWNFIYDGDASVTSGTFRSSSAAAYAANNLLRSLGSYSGPIGNVVFLNSMPGRIGQDQVRFRVSEPASLLMLALGAFIVGSRRKRRAA